jgi:macrolide transport system ATP-binding/permease protein
MALLEIRDLSFTYRPVDKEGQEDLSHSVIPILSKVEITVDRGELVAIQGPSGSGKSTLLALLAGFLQMQTGTIYLDGHLFSSLKNNELSYFRNQKIGFIFQQFHLLPKLNVLENILLPSQYAPNLNLGAANEKAIQLAKYLEIDHRLFHHPNQLSGGQQQRVAIARALLHDPDLILADEPTGNLDSKSAQNIMDLLLDLNRKGKTIIIITHSDEIAAQCNRSIQLKDGKVVNGSVHMKSTAEILLQTRIPAAETTRPLTPLSSFNAAVVVREAWKDILSNKIRSFLTMIGIIVGVASILAMITLGRFIKEKVLESYAEMGVNTVLFMGYPNWNLKATDSSGVLYKSFKWQTDIMPLTDVFAEIEKMTPLMTGNRTTLAYAGKTIESEGRPVGVNEHAFEITGRKLRLGRNFSPFHIEQKNSVCIIGSEIAEKLFIQVNPLNQILNVQGNQSSFGCKIIGVLENQTSNKGWNNPNLEVYLPYTLYQSLAENPWDAEITRVLIQLKSGSDIPETGKAIQGYFTARYGKTGRFRIHNDSVMIAQLQKFLSLFTVALGAIAMICLIVGGVGITNMMLASIAERFREIGLRKALGATNPRIRQHILLESVLLCGLAGIFGLMIGFTCYELVIYIASKFVPSLEFQWRFDTSAFFIAFVSIAAVGIISGLAPALKAERLQILEALRSD